jgi:isoleucyl-tRNA synthetase
MYREGKGLNLVEVDKEILAFWKDQNVFEKSITSREGKPNFVFYEGPPSANGLPGIHHVIGRTVKDIFCRYKTLNGYKVKRKGGWDTHGLPVELKVEQELGITKVDIGTKISVEEYNQKCRETVLEYKHIWDDLTVKMGYWLDLENPYITYENDYIESVWHILETIYNKGLLYKGLTIQPYSPAAGTGLSSHELNQPGCYKDVTDTTAVACFKVAEDSIGKLNTIFGSSEASAFIIAWTTTPWTLVSNTALCVGPNIEYALVRTFNPYTFEPQCVVLACDLISKWFKPEHQKSMDEKLVLDEKNIPYQILGTAMGSELVGISYEQLLPFEANSKDQIQGEAFKVISGAFVTTSDGTGIVHIAPSFGADDRQVAHAHGVGELTMVDKEGKFVDGLGALSGRYVKNYKDETDYKNPDIDISILLKSKGQAFNVQKYVHSYPHCWRTDKPVIYYPLDSWFINMQSVKDQLIENNKKINWKPESTGTGRFGQWLENIQDWSLSRSRFWGIPLPLWVSEDRTQEICIGSKDQLFAEINSANESGLLTAGEKEQNEKYVQLFGQGKGDFHKPYIDRVTLIKEGQVLKRELDVIDVWFDSGSMPYAQWHAPFENQSEFNEMYPADFIAEGVDQTRGWFYTLHAISTLLFDRPAFKNVISNGLVLDKNGEKMSKRKGNVIDPFETIGTYGADAVRWYIVSNAAPWDNLKFDIKGIEEVSRKLYGTLYNTYSFFALYANVDQMEVHKTSLVPVQERAELDRWILSKLHSLIKEVSEALEDYEPHRAARAIETFVDRNLSNWYVRLCRRRFWKNEVGQDKLAAYQTLFECLSIVSQLMSPISPFFGEWLYKNLHTDSESVESVHLTNWPKVKEETIDARLEHRMEIAQEVCSMVLSLRKKEQIKVRQPLQKIMVPVLHEQQKEVYLSVEDIIKTEVNIKQIECVEEQSGLFVKSAKANFKTLGKKLGKDMNDVAQQIASMDQYQISQFEKNAAMTIVANGNEYQLNQEDIEIMTADMPGYLVASEGGITLALDITLTEELINEGLAREFINKVQNYRKDNGFEVTDKIEILVKKTNLMDNVLSIYNNYISNEVLAAKIECVESIESPALLEINEQMLEVKINHC